MLNETRFIFKINDKEILNKEQIIENYIKKEFKFKNMNFSIKDNTLIIDLSYKGDLNSFLLGIDKIIVNLRDKFKLK